MSEPKKAKGARQATPFHPAEFHLGDLVGALWRATRETIRGHRPGDPGAERYPKATVHDQAVRDYIQGKLVQWGGMSGEQFQAYAADAGASWGIYKGVTKDKPLPDDEDTSDKASLVRREAVPPYGDHGQQEVCEALARLHNEGLTQRLLAYLWENFPDFAEARGLPRPEESAPRSTTQAEPWLPAKIEEIYNRGEFARLDDDDEFAILGAYLNEQRRPLPRSLAEMARDTRDADVRAENDRRAKVMQRLRETYGYNVNRRAQAVPAQTGERMESSKLPASRRRSGVDAINTDQGQKRRREKPGRRQRRSLPPEDEAKVLERCRRRCCVCFVLDGDASERKGQLAHLDKDRSNNTIDNFVYLCFHHHDTYDSTTSQSKNLTEHEVRLHQAKLHQAVEQGEVPRRR